MALILDLGQFGGFIETTASFSNAVVVAMLPYITDVAQRLGLPLPQPITQEQIVAGGPNPIFETRNGEMMGCGFRFKGGWVIGFQSGHLSHLETPHAYYALQDPGEIPKFVGTVRMTKAEAVQMARDTLEKLGIPLEAVFAEQEPHVNMPPQTRTGIAPHYLIKWLDPRSSPDPESWAESVEMEINAGAKRVEYIKILPNPNLRRPWPELALSPLLRAKRLSANPEYAWKLLPIVLRAVDDYGKTLALPVPRPLSSNHVTRFTVSDNGGWPHSELELTNGWRFIYRNKMVNGYYAPDNFFNSDRRPIRIKDFAGKWNLTEAEATGLIRRTLAKLNYPTNLVRMEFAPKVNKPAIPGIPRYSFWWWCENETHDDLVCKVEAEVDADKRELKSLYFDHTAFWGQPPPIEVPISPLHATSSNSHSPKPIDRPTIPRPPQSPKSVKTPR